MARPDSEDGWRPPRLDPESPDLIWIIVPGTNPPVHLQIMRGDPLILLPAFAADLNEHVEHMRDADSACYTPTNFVSTSNHLNATAFDFNWDSHKFHEFGTFNADQMRTLTELFAFYSVGDLSLIAWGGKDWAGDPQDEMHFQMGYNTWNNPQVGEWMRTHIRPDGFSTFRRGGQAGPPAQPQVMTVPLTPLPNGRWTSPSPAWAHLITRESGGNPTIIQQIIDVNSGGNEAEGLFQITPATWRAHSGDHLAPSPRLATPQQQAIIAARIFTRNPSGSDWGAGLPGREDAGQLAAGLVPLTDTPTQGEDELSAEAERMIKEIHDEWSASKLGPSRSFMAVDGKLIESPLGFLYNMDGNIWSQELTWAYLFDVSLAVEIVETVAQNGSYEGSWVQSNAFNAWLNQFGQEYCQGLIAFKQALVAKLVGSSSPQQSSGTGGVMRLPEPVSEPTHVLTPVTNISAQNSSGPKNLGDVVKTVVDAVQELNLSDSLSAADYATLDASIKILEMKNGTK